MDVDTKAELEADGKSFNSILVLDGEPVVGGIKTKKGESIFVSAGTGKYEIEGKCQFILTKID